MVCLESEGVIVGLSSWLVATALCAEDLIAANSSSRCPLRSVEETSGRNDMVALLERTLVFMNRAIQTIESRRDTVALMRGRRTVMMTVA